MVVQKQTSLYHPVGLRVCVHGLVPLVGTPHEWTDEAPVPVGMILVDDHGISEDLLWWLVSVDDEATSVDLLWCPALVVVSAMVEVVLRVSVVV